MIDIDIVCPIYKGFHYLEPLYNSFLVQKKVNIKNVVFAITDSQDDEMDKIREFVKEKNITNFVVSKEEFSHSLTREKAIKEYCSSKCVIMLSQDVKLTNEDVFFNLVKDIDEGNTVYIFL